MHRLAFSRHSFVRFCAVLGVVAVGLLVSSSAFAYGRVVWKQTTIQEHTKKEAWYLQMEFHLPKAPDIAHKSMKFEFQQMAEYERALVDGQDEPVVRTIPLTNQQALIESQTVGFMDPGSGQIQSRTRFSFKVTRSHGYRAGKWQVKIKDGDTGQPIGATTTLNLVGENPVIDRRSIVFKGRDDDEKSSKKSKKEPQQETDAAAAAEPVATESSEPGATAPASEDEGQVPPSIEEKPGGGCHHGPAHGDQWGWAIVALMLGGFAFRRMRS